MISALPTSKSHNYLIEKCVSGSVDTRRQPDFESSLYDSQSESNHSSQEGLPENLEEDSSEDYEELNKHT